MKLELKLISLMLSLGLFSLPAQSLCPGGATQCGDGSCCADTCPCSEKVERLNGTLEYVYLLPEGTSYYCENGQSPKPSASGAGGSSSFVCSLENFGRNAKPRQPTPFTPQENIIYAVGENMAIQCATGESPIQKGKEGKVWSCPAKASKSK